MERVATARSLLSRHELLSPRLDRCHGAVGTVSVIDGHRDHVEIFRDGMSADVIRDALPHMPINETILARVCPTIAIDDCVPASKYRRLSGSCNNVQRPLQGASYEPLQRLLPAAYADAVGTLRVGRDGRPLVSPRRVSRLLFGAGPRIPHRHCSQALAHWALFVYADLVHIASSHLFKGDHHLAVGHRSPHVVVSCRQRVDSTALLCCRPSRVSADQD